MGGNIATNAGGIKVVRYGLTRDWVIGLEVVTGTGEVLNLNNGLVKNATGLDLRHLFIGSEGILGFITKAKIKLAPLPPALKVIVLALDQMNSVMKVFSEFKKQMTLQAYEVFSEKALGIGFHSLQMHSEKVQTHLIVLLRNVDGLSHTLYEKIRAVRQENFTDERMRLRKVLADFSQSAADLRKSQVVNLAHGCESMTLEKI